MGIHDSVQAAWREMMKSSAYIKHFRHQCTTLIQLSRHFSLRLNHGRTDAPFHQEFILLEIFLLASSDALNIVRDGTSQKKLDEGEKALKRAKKALRDYLEYTGTFDIGYDDLRAKFLRPLDMLDEAQGKDHDRAKHIINLDRIKKPKPSQDTKKVHVVFCVHDGGGGRMLDLEHKLCRASTIEEVIFKFNRGDPKHRIGPSDNASFYVNFKSDCRFIAGLGIHKGTTGQYSSHKALSESELQAYLTSPSGQPARKIHVLVDRNPRVQVLMEGPNWARTYSLCRTHVEDPTMLMKGVDGKLYHSQDILRKLIEDRPEPVKYEVYGLNKKMDRKPMPTSHLTQRGWLEILQQVHQEIMTGQDFVYIGHSSTSEIVYKWLLKFPLLPTPAAMTVQIPPHTPVHPNITSDSSPHPPPRQRVMSRAISILPIAPPTPLVPPPLVPQPLVLPPIDIAQQVPARTSIHPRPGPSPMQFSTTTPSNLSTTPILSDPSVPGERAGSISGSTGGSQNAQSLLKGISRSAQDSEKSDKKKSKSFFGIGKFWGGGKSG